MSLPLRAENGRQQNQCVVDSLSDRHCQQALPHALVCADQTRHMLPRACHTGKGGSRLAQLQKTRCNSPRDTIPVVCSSYPLRPSPMSQNDGPANVPDRQNMILRPQQPIGDNILQTRWALRRFAWVWEPHAIRLAPSVSSGHFGRPLTLALGQVDCWAHYARSLGLTHMEFPFVNWTVRCQCMLHRCGRGRRLPGQ